MDNDYERRGKTCLHILEGVGYAQMVAIELLTSSLLKFNECVKNLVEYSNGSKECMILMHHFLGKNIKKLSEGQYIDVTNKLEVIDDKDIAIKIKNNDVINMINYKTGSLFELSFIIPFLIVNCQNKFDESMMINFNELLKIGQLFGLLFQISDDFEDYDKDFSTDRKNSVMNYVIVYGLNKSLKDYYSFDNELKKLLNSQGIKSKEINLILDYLKDKSTSYYYDIIKNS